MSRIAVNNVPRRPTGRLKPQHNLNLRGPVSREDLLAHTDPGPPEEAEEFVRLIHALRRKTKSRQLPE